LTDRKIRNLRPRKAQRIVGTSKPERSKRFKSSKRHDVRPQEITKALATQESGSQALFRTYLEQANDLIFATDISGKMTFVNTETSQVTGYRANELLGRSPIDIVVPEARDIVARTAERVSRGERVERIEVEILSKDARKIFLEVRGRPLSVRGHVVGSLYIARDVTARSEAERKLVESEQRFRGLVEGTSAAVAVADLMGRFTYVNKALADLLGYSVRELTGQAFADFLHPEDRHKVMEVFIQAISSSSEAPNIEFRAVCKDASIRNLWSRPTRLKIDGKTVGFEAIIIDITERKRMQDELQKHSEHLEELVFERTKRLARSERKYRSLVENIPDFIWTSDREANTVFVGPNVERMSGYTPEEIYKGGYRLWSQRIHPDDIERLEKAYQLLFSEDEPFDVEYRFQKKDGEWLWLHDRATGTYARDGVLYADGVTSDITERKRLEEELRAAREHLEHVITSNPAAIYTATPRRDLSDFDTNYMSRSVVSLTGFEPEDFIGHPQIWYDRVHPDDLHHIYVELPLLWKEGQHIFEYRFLHKDTSYRWIREEARVVRNANGEPVEVIGYWSDVTEDKRMQEALLRSERLAAIGEMATMMAHDLRNPLTGISGAAYHLRKKLGATADGKLQEMFELIEKDIEHANRILSDLLEYSRELHLDLSGTTPRSITEQALALVEIPSAVRVSDLTNNQPEVRMDAEKMKRVFVNLIRNAVDAMPQGGDLTIQSKESNGNLQVSFSDTGGGITEEVASRMWTPFFTTKAKGVGLGLSISKRVVEAHKGHISYETKVGKGTTFVVTIPLQANNHD
jgi:two-component system sporulation sensor kinase A